MSKKDLQRDASPLTKEYETSVQIVNRMWKYVSNTQGILLTLAEATVPNSEQCDALKSLIKREFNNMGGYVQDAIYEEYGVQEKGKGRKSELPFSLSKEK